MKRLFALVALCLLSAVTLAQKEKQTKEIFTEKDSIMFEYFDAYLQQLREPCFELYPTDNMWTFIKLDTRTGKLWQVQYSVKSSSNAFQTILDTSDRVYDGNYICGRFVLYKTQNMYNFILLDRIDGRCWQVQWSQDGKEGVWRIY
jgi:predicted aldo/keto reductase-like oxidoreductase